LAAEKMYYFVEFPQKQKEIKIE